VERAGRGCGCERIRERERVRDVRDRDTRGERRGADRGGGLEPVRAGEPLDTARRVRAELRDDVVADDRGAAENDDALGLEPPELSGGGRVERAARRGVEDGALVDAGRPWSAVVTK
jgi:hypothetical protein